MVEMVSSCENVLTFEKENNQVEAFLSGEKWN